MQERHLDRHRYFTEKSATSAQYYLPYIQSVRPLRAGDRILEIGCGEGGNLLPFAKLGHEVAGVDITAGRIEQAKSYFADSGYNGRFMTADFLTVQPYELGDFDVIIICDVIEHIDRKDEFILHVQTFLNKGGIVFWAFPAWHMPFGGHQQIARSKWISHFPYVHLLPASLYHSLLRACGENDANINELMRIKQTRISIEGFEFLMHAYFWQIARRLLWLVNPHYKQKFGMRPCKLFFPLSKMSYVRDFFATSCFYITKR
ncbi:MAG: class I SAM-dependent methyltransferase [Mediterranea sp.]|jgi:SAM-dependent methyltransferase|nr:class I SAM-dependent methyltransferase [Mediterranea sp.]